MLKLKVGYPSKQEERQILDLMGTSAPNLEVQRILEPSDIISARKLVNAIFVDGRVKDYIVDIVFATREPASYGLSDIVPFLRYGASPRATIALTLAARANAYLSGRGFVTPHDVKSVAADVLRHRVITSFEADAEEITTENIVSRVLGKLPVP